MMSIMILQSAIKMSYDPFYKNLEVVQEWKENWCACPYKVMKWLLLALAWDVFAHEKAHKKKHPCD